MKRADGVISVQGRFIGALLLGLAWATTTLAYDTPAKQALMVDFNTGAVLFEKNASAIMSPASMTKMMTMYLLFERIKRGDLSLEDTFPVSTKAYSKGGSKMFVEIDDRVQVEDLIRGIVVQSGNDASIVVAEGLAGTEEAFAEEMTRKAREIGMQDSVFRNSTGWPDPDHVTTARDLTILASRTIRDFPEFYHYYSEKSFTYNEIRQGNRNPLLYKDVGADGLKTGHTEDSGYGLCASAERNGRRLILVVNGLESVRQRSTEAERLLDWGYREFSNYQLFKSGSRVADAEVWLGASPKVPLHIERDLTVTLPRKARREMKVITRYQGPVPAPLKKGTRIAELIVTAPGVETINVPLIAGADVARLGFARRITSALGFLIWGPSEN